MRVVVTLIILVLFIMTGCSSNESPQDTIRFEKYHSNGKPSILGQKVKSTGKAIGEWKYYDNNGQLKESGFFRNGKEHGEWNRYNQSGEIISTSYYSNGKNFRTVIPWD